MTREAIEYFKFHRKIFCDDHLKICPKDSIAYQATLKEKEFYDLAIKALEQEHILDEIRAEIEQTTSRYCISRERGGSGQVEWSDRLIKESEVLEIIDKYKVESEG